MEVRNCRSCGRLFNDMGGPPICQACRKKLEDKFQEVKAYLREHPDSSVSQVAEDNDVSVKQIKQWIREERLTLSQATEDGITCEHCGVPICSGRFCDKCKVQMQNTLAGAIDKPKEAEIKKAERDGNRMRFLSDK